MVSVFLAVVLAFAPHAGAPPPAGNSALDQRCYRLMAELADNEDPRIRTAAMTGAQYFLGRLDADGEEPGEVAGPLAQREREVLIGRCGDLMGAGGRDFRALGERLARPDDVA